MVRSSAVLTPQSDIWTWYFLYRKWKTYVIMQMFKTYCTKHKYISHNWYLNARLYQILIQFHCFVIQIQPTTKVFIISIRSSYKICQDLAHLPCDRNKHEPANSIKDKHDSRLDILSTSYPCACKLKSITHV